MKEKKRKEKKRTKLDDWIVNIFASVKPCFSYMELYQKHDLYILIIIPR